MSFKSVDEIYNFDFQDAVISKFKIGNEGINIELESLIVEPENSQNENYTKSYAATTTVRLVDGKILSGIKEGYKRYDANNKLIESVDDVYIDDEQIKLIMKSSNGAYLFAMDANPESEEGRFSYNISIEFPSQEEYDLTGGVIYEIKVSFSKAVFEWDKYMNKVQM